MFLKAKRQEKRHESDFQQSWTIKQAVRGVFKD